MLITIIMGVSTAIGYGFPGYYSTQLTKYDITTEVTIRFVQVSLALHSLEGRATSLLNLGEGLTNREVVRGTACERIPRSRGISSRHLLLQSSSGLSVYFVMKVSKVPKSSGYWKLQRPMTGVESRLGSRPRKYKLYTKYARELSISDDVRALLHI